ncbi:hypothetical protein KPATCC21470_8306 [Kitasatospora purpeofusca]
MTTPQDKRRRRRPAAPATVPAPAVHGRAARPPAPARPRRAGGCCGTWSSEHLTRDARVVRTVWHEPACRGRKTG